MPKKSVSQDVPIWNALVAEIGDPRPYEPVHAEFSTSYVPSDEPFIDPDYFDHLLYELSLERDNATDAFGGWGELASEAMDKIWPWPPRLAELRNMSETTTQLAAVVD